MTIRRITSIPLFTAMIIVFTIVVPPINVPYLNLPFTLQTFVVMLAALVLKPVDAFISMLLYVIIGALGFPVFSGLSGGMGVILGPSGGFILAFPFAAFLISLFTQKRNFINLLVFNILFGIIFVYIFGVLTLSIFYKQPYYIMAIAMSWFVIFDLFKAILAVIISQKLNKLELIY